MIRILNYRRLFALLISASLATHSVAESVSFRSDIAPVLLDNCLACHGEKKTEGGYRVDTFALLSGDQSDSGSAGIVAGNRAESEVFRRIASDDVDERMPLEGEPLSVEFVSLLQQWIDQGADFDGTDPQALLTSYAPLAQPDPPGQYQQTVPISAIHFSSDGSELFVGGYYEITVWSPVDGKLLRRINGASQRTTAIDLSGDGKTIAVAGGVPGKRGTVRLFDTESGELLEVFARSTDMVLDLQYSPDGRQLAAGTAESLLLLIDLERGRPPTTITGHSDWVTAVAWSPDGKSVGTGSRDRTAKIFDVESGEILRTYSKHEKTVRGIAFHPDGGDVFSAGDDKKIHRWKIEDGKKLAEVSLGGEVNKSPLIGHYLFAASADKTVRQIDAKTSEEVRQFTGHQDWVLSAAFHEASRRVASGGFNGEVIIWNAEDGSQICHFVAAPGYQTVHQHGPVKLAAERIQAAP